MNEYYDFVTGNQDNVWKMIKKNVANIVFVENPSEEIKEYVISKLGKKHYLNKFSKNTKKQKPKHVDYVMQPDESLIDFNKEALFDVIKNPSLKNIMKLYEDNKRDRAFHDDATIHINELRQLSGNQLLNFLLKYPKYAKYYVNDFDEQSIMKIIERDPDIIQYVYLRNLTDKIKWKAYFTFEKIDFLENIYWIYEPPVDMIIDAIHKTLDEGLMNFFIEKHLTLENIMKGIKKTYPYHMMCQLTKYHIPIPKEVIEYAVEQEHSPIIDYITHNRVNLSDESQQILLAHDYTFAPYIKNLNREILKQICTV